MAQAKKKQRRAKPNPKTVKSFVQPKGGKPPTNQVPSIPPWITDLGLPPEVYNTVIKILSGDPTGGADTALAYIRGTPWYAQNYAGIGALIKAGVVGNEGEYRQWKHAINQSYQQNYGRAATQQELINFANQGFDASTVNQIGQGHAWVKANQSDVEYAFGAFDQGQLNQGQLQALGEQASGRSSDLGTKLQSRFQAAMAKMQRVFEGTLAQAGPSAPFAPSLSGNQQRQQDIGA
jgi:hypothetical protein